MCSATLERDLDINPKRVGRPRLDPHQRLLSRFYEPLFLLNALGQTRGNHTFPPFELDTGRAQVRRFLQNLCYICDFRKGGSACTAIGLEELETCYNFCVASNKETGKVAAFQETSLSALRAIAHPTSTNYDYKVMKFLQVCFEFAAERIEEEKKCLRRGRKDCLSTLNGQTVGADSKLVEWLEEVVSFDDHFQLCLFAYDTRHSDHIIELSHRGLNEETRLGPTSKRSSFFLVRHYIGRLAHHIRASKQLIEDTPNLSRFLDNHAVHAIDVLSAVPPPIRDSHVNLRGILNRMFKKGDEERLQVEDGLLHLNKVAGVFEKFLHQYERSSPEVHAEVQVLEHFHRMRKSFAGDDRFVASSKPACLCCEMYFKYHPARAMVSCSHRKVWTNWSPPHLCHSDGKNRTFRQQTDILNPMTKDLREQVITHVLQRLPSSRWHPDSITNITNIRRPDITSVRLEVSDAGITKPSPIVDLSTHLKRSNSLSGTAISHTSDVEADFDGISDPEDDGASLLDYSTSILHGPGRSF